MEKPIDQFLQRPGRYLAPMLAVALLAGCVAPQVHSTAQHRPTGLAPGALEAHGIAFITPSTVTGQEEEKQTVALSFAEVLTHERPEIRVVTLSQTLSAVNRAGLADEYRHMFGDYRDTGIFKNDTLRRVGDLTGTRYIAQLKLQGFSQGSRGRLSVLGLRVLETKYADIRLFLQIWNATDGTIAWEGVQETTYSEDAFTEKNITLKRVLEATARDLIARLP